LNLPGRPQDRTPLPDAEPESPPDGPARRFEQRHLPPDAEPCTFRRDWFVDLPEEVPMTRSVSEIACGKYTAGHDMHVIAVNRTAGTPGLEGTVRWEDTAVFTSDDGVEYQLYNHRPEVLRSLVERAGRCRLLEENHFLWVELPPRSGTSADGGTGRAVINISFAPPDPCGAAIDHTSRDAEGKFKPIPGGN